MSYKCNRLGWNFKQVRLPKWCTIHFSLHIGYLLIQASQITPQDTAAIVSDSAPLYLRDLTDTIEELKCYSLPYGAFGFISHLLSLWRIFCNVVGISTFLPWKRLKEDDPKEGIQYYFAVLTAAIAVVSPPVLCILAIVRCSKQHQLVMLIIWKMFFDLFIAVIGFQKARRSKSELNFKETYRIWSLLSMSIP